MIVALSPGPEYISEYIMMMQSSGERHHDDLSDVPNRRDRLVLLQRQMAPHVLKELQGFAI